MKKALLLLLSAFCFSSALDESMEEKNRQIADLRAELYALYDQVTTEASPELLAEVKGLKERLASLEKEALQKGSQASEEAYAFWNNRDITIEKLLVEYSPGDALYLIPSEIGQIKLSLRADLPVPRALWPALIEQILFENGVEIDRISPYVKSLKLSKNHILGLSVLTDSLDVLDSYAGELRGALLVHTGFCETKKTRFLESMAKGHNLTAQLFEQEALFIGKIDHLRAFARLSRFILASDQAAEVKTYWTQKLSAKEAKRLLEVALSSRSGRFASSTPRAVSDLKIFASSELDHLLLFCGSESQVQRAIEMVGEIEKEIQDPEQTQVFWYECKHALAEDIAATLAKVYPQMEQTVVEEAGAADAKVKAAQKEKIERFVVDAKTSSIIMIVEKRRLGQIQELLEKLDTPKKMVKIEVLLFEKTTRDSNEFGLESLKIGGEKTDRGGVIWRGAEGLLDFLLPRGRRGSIPAYSLAYRLLLASRDLQLNSCPSITTMNATPATISIMDEISIDNGITYIENRDQANPRKSFSREKFGISITLTPTINPPDPARGESEGSITLESNINFESIHRSGNKDRPDVTKRHVENQVRIPNGQTVVIGGLRKKNAEGSSGKIPFLGQMPGIGKFFSFSEMLDEQTEMFIFITPRIITNELVEREKLEKEELKKRPGDRPAFIRALDEARLGDEEQLFAESFKLFFAERA